MTNRPNPEDFEENIEYWQNESAKPPRVTRIDLAQRVHSQMGGTLSLTVIEEACRSIVSGISDSLSNGETVKLNGFGTFGLRDRAPYTGRNPGTGEAVSVGPTRTIFFRPSAFVRQLTSKLSKSDTQESLLVTSKWNPNQHKTPSNS